MDEGRERQWLRRHAILAPFGIFAATALLVVRSGQWGGWDSLGLAAEIVDLGAVLYAMVAVLAERGIDMVFWALERKKQRELERKQRELENKAKVQAEILVQLLAGEYPQSKEELEEWAKKKGIPLDDTPPR